jgi:hypothetical protein
MGIDAAPGIEHRMQHGHQASTSDAVCIPYRLRDRDHVQEQDPQQIVCDLYTSQ